jgi:hypothetical protein
MLDGIFSFAGEGAENAAVFMAECCEVFRDREFPRVLHLYV